MNNGIFDFGFSILDFPKAWEGVREHNRTFESLHRSANCATGATGPVTQSKIENPESKIQ
jgi:hypothetical protein